MRVTAIYGFMLKALTTFLLIICKVSFAQDSNTDPLKITSVKIKDQQLELQVKIEKGYRAYLDQFELIPNEMFSRIEADPLQSFVDPVTQKNKYGIVESGTILADVQGANIDAILKYQVCTDTVCLLPKEIPFKTTIGMDNKFTKALNKGFIYALITIFFAGFLSSLTPCVFPMIPITISILGTGVINQNRLKSFLISSTYVLGVATTYSILGVLAASTGSILGTYMADPKVIVVLSIIFILMGLSMYGLFDIKMPSFVVSRLNVDKRKGFGIFLSGIVTGVVASPCVGPVLIGLLLYVSTTQDMFLGFSFLFAFAIGFGILLILLGMFGQLINKLPKSGGWLEGAKFIFGTVMIAMAFFYIRPLINSTIFYVVSGSTSVVIALSFGLLKSKSNTVALKVKKITLTLLFAVGMLMISRGVFSTSFEKMFAVEKSEIFKEYDQSLFDNALENNIPVVLDFWAAWCPSCIKLDRQTFSDDRVIDALDGFLLFKIDNTLNTKNNQALKNKLKVIGLPTVIFYDRDGRLREDMTLTGYENADQFLRRLDSL